MFVEKVDALRQRKHGGIAGKNNGDRGNGDEHWFDIMKHGFGDGCTREKGHSEVDEYKILRKLGESGKNVFCGPLCSP